MSTHRITDHDVKLAMYACPYRIFEVIHGVNDLIVILPQPKHDARLGVYPTGLCLFQDIQRLEVAGSRISYPFLQHRQRFHDFLTRLLAFTQVAAYLHALVVGRMQQKK